MYVKKLGYSDKFCVEPHRNIENIARNTVCHIFLCGLYLAPLKLSEYQKIYTNTIFEEQKTKRL